MVTFHAFNISDALELLHLRKRAPPPDMDTQTTIDTMNAMAGKSTPHESLGKRARGPEAENEQRSPSKRRATQDAPKSPKGKTRTSPKRLSGRLKARASLAATQPRASRNSFDIPDDEEPQKQLAPVQKGKKTISLQKKLAKSKSPLKEHPFGTIRPEFDHGVNLQDSPAQNTRHKRPNIEYKALDFDKPLISPSKITFASKRPKPKRKAQPKMVGPAVDGAELESENEEPEQSPPEHQKKDTIEPPKRGRPRKTLPAKKKSTENPIAEQSKEQREKERHPPEEDIEAEQRRIRDELKELPRDNPDERYEEYRKEFARGIENAISYLGCEKDWTTLGATAREIKHLRPRGESLSSLGTIIVDLITNLRDGYSALSCDDNSENDDAWSAIKRDREELQRCLHLLKPNMEKSQWVVRDLNQYVIPSMANLMKKALAKTFLSSEPDDETCDDITALLATFYAFVHTARSWKTQPSLEAGILGAVRNDIFPSLRRIHARWSGEVQNRRDQKGLLSLEEAQRQANARLEGVAQRKWEELRNASRRSLQLEATSAERGHLSQRDKRPEDIGRRIYDIDDLEPDLSSTVAGERAAAPQRLSSHVALSGNPRPPPRAWTEEETIALLNGLQIYSGRERYHDILIAFGDPGDALEDRNADELYRQALSLKKDMLEELKADRGDSWDWLRTV